MKILCVFGEHNYGNPARGTGYEFSNFLPTLRGMGHEVVFFESFSRQGFKNFAEMNRCFLEVVENERPDLIFCVLMGYELWMETFALIRSVMDTLIINWATDDSWKYEQFSRWVAPSFDLYATTYPSALKSAQRDGYTHFFLTQWAANQQHLLAPVPTSECRWPVSFVGSAYGNRVKWVSALQSRGIPVDCFGYGWPSGPVSAERIPEIIRHSVISLNFADSNWVLSGLRLHRSRQIKARVFEVPGYGGFLMTERADDLDLYFEPGKEIVTFENIDDLSAKIKFYLDTSKARDRIAQAGHRRTREEHTYDKRFSMLLEAVRNIQMADAYRNSDEREEKQSIAQNRFARLERRHRRLGAGFKLLRHALVTPCSLLFGRKRGPRAARRILFELSWRLAGDKTYSASGWPGRLFYYES